jgi:prevent-host-death family protein
MVKEARTSKLREVPLSEIESDLPRFLREAEQDDIIITNNGRPAGVLVGFASEDDWFDYQLVHDPRFVRRIDDARKSLRKGRGVKLDDVE